MYTGKHAKLRPLQPAFILANSGEAVSYAELDARANRIAHYLRRLGLKRLDHFAIFMENNSRYLEACGAGERTGLYFTCVNSFLTPGELAYIVTNSQSKVLFTSKAKLDVARQALAECPDVLALVVMDALPGEFTGGDRILSLMEATADCPKTPVADEALGTAMLYSSGTTGRPKGILRALAEQPPVQNMPLFEFLIKLWQYREGMIYLSPAPLYHSAPQAAVNLTIRMGGTAIIMESFDPERYLELIEIYGVTHTQLVPTMFSRMLKLPEAARKRYDLSSLEIAIHAAAPCPVQVKREMIQWWGPIIHEYYGATEGLGHGGTPFCGCSSGRGRTVHEVKPSATAPAGQNCWRFSTSIDGGMALQAEAGRAPADYASTSTFHSAVAGFGSPWAPRTALALDLPTKSPQHTAISAPPRTHRSRCSPEPAFRGNGSPAIDLGDLP